MKVSELLAGLHIAVAASGGKAELFNGMTCVSNGRLPGNSEVIEHLNLYACYVKWVAGATTASGDLSDSLMRTYWGDNFNDFWYAMRMPAHRLGRRQRWIKRLIRQSLLPGLTRRRCGV